MAAADKIILGQCGGHMFIKQIYILCKYKMKKKNSFIKFTPIVKGLEGFRGTFILFGNLILPQQHLECRICLLPLCFEAFADISLLW
jgi:hypothetical protein